MVNNGRIAWVDIYTIQQRVIMYRPAKWGFIAQAIISINAIIDIDKTL